MTVPGLRPTMALHAVGFGQKPGPVSNACQAGVIVQRWLVMGIESLMAAGLCLSVILLTRRNLAEASARQSQRMDSQWIIKTRLS